MTAFGEKSFSPALLQTDGKILAATCRAAAGREWGYIEIVTQISTDGGKSWSEAKTALRPPARAINSDMNNTKSAFFLNPVLAKTADGEILMLVTFFPESKGAADMKYLEKKKTAFTYFDGQRCPIIYDRDGSYYIVMENGAVIDKSKAKTAYTVKGIGELYKGEEYMGNVFLNGAQGKSESENAQTTFGSLLKTPKRSHIFMLKSADGGESWSEPKNITPYIVSEADGPLLMTASGAGLTTKSGRIIIPLYSAKGAAAIYSDDGGETWSRNPRMPYIGTKGKWSAVQTPDSAVYVFGEGKAAVSADNGILWSKSGKLPSSAAKAAKSALRLGSNIFLCAKMKGGGGLIIADMLSDKKNRYKDFKWRKEMIPISDGAFGSSALCAVDKHTLGIAFETDAGVQFKTVNIE